MSKIHKSSYRDGHFYFSPTFIKMGFHCTDIYCCATFFTKLYKNDTIRGVVLFDTKMSKLAVTFVNQNASFVIYMFVGIFLDPFLDWTFFAICNTV